MSEGAEAMNENLIPPEDTLFDGAHTRNDFIWGGKNFVAAYLVARAKLQPDERVLDIGFGNGQKAFALTEYLSAEGSYEGIDVVQSGVDWCREKYAGFPNFRFHRIDVESDHYNRDGAQQAATYRLPFDDNEFDVVFLCSVFTHMMPDAVANYISEIARVLKPCGRCVATCCLINDEATNRAAEGAALQFEFRGADYWLLHKDRPLFLVALNEAWIRRRFARAGLRTGDILFGNWSGGKDHLLNSSQDVIIAVKPG